MAEQGNYCVPAFNVYNVETVKGSGCFALAKSCGLATDHPFYGHSGEPLTAINSQPTSFSFDPGATLRKKMPCRRKCLSRILNYFSNYLMSFPVTACMDAFQMV